MNYQFLIKLPFVVISSYQLEAYRRHYGTKKVLVRLLEEWKNNLDKNKITGADLLDLSKDVCCIPHGLLIARLSVYRLDRKEIKLI